MISGFAEWTYLVRECNTYGSVSFVFESRGRVFVVFHVAAWRFSDGRCCVHGAWGCVANLLDARLTWLFIVGGVSLSVLLAL